MNHDLLKLRARRERYFRGDLEWKLHEGQRRLTKAVENSSGQLVVGHCSRQIGKSFWAVTKVIELGITKSYARMIYGTAYHSDLVEFIMPAFVKVLEDSPESIKPVYKTAGSKWLFPSTKAEVRLVGLDVNPDGLRGNTPDLIIIDEAGFVANLSYLYKSIIIPATMHRPHCKIILISSSPSTPAHEFVDFIQKAETEGSYIKLTIDDNPMIDVSTKTRLAKESGGIESTTWRREYLCDLITDQDLQIIPEWDDKYVQKIERSEFFEHYHKYVGMDLGVKDFTAPIFGYYDFKRAAVVIEDEFTMSGPKMTTDLLAKEIKAKEVELWKDLKPFRRVSDNNNPLLIQDLNSLHDLTFCYVEKDSLAAMVNELRLIVKAGRLLVNPKCTMLIGCLKYGVWTEKRDKFARSNVYGHFDHLAALIYLIRMIAWNSNPVPATHGFDPSKAWLHNVATNHSKNANMMKDSLIPKKKPLLNTFR